MRQEKFRLPVDTLFILGAGSSRALTDVKRRNDEIHRYTTPLDFDFLELMKKSTPKRGWQKKSLTLLNDNWLDTSDFWSSKLEESIINRVAHYDMLKALHRDKARRKVDNGIYLNHLSHLITDYLWQCRSNNSGSTRRFVDYVYPKGTKPSSYKNRIISFNYDMVIDRPLLDRGISKQKIYFDGFHNKREDEVVRGFKEGFDDPLLLKLHGSLNWRCHQKDFERIINGELDTNEKIPVWSSDGKLPSPDDNDSPLIIPPIPNKPITQSRLFRHLWCRALEHLHQARKIVLIGYSCPLTDVMARSIFTQFTNKKVTDIYVVDPAVNSLDNYVTLMSKRVNSKVRWHYSTGFNEYMENELKLTKS